MECRYFWVCKDKIGHELFQGDSSGAKVKRVAPDLWDSIQACYDTPS